MVVIWSLGLFGFLLVVWFMLLRRSCDDFWFVRLFWDENVIFDMLMYFINLLVRVDCCFIG